MIDQFLTT